MSTILENLKLYLQNNSRETILKDWNSLDRFNNVGPSISMFFNEYNMLYHIKTDPAETQFYFKNNNYPNFCSDFFLF